MGGLGRVAPSATTSPTEFLGGLGREGVGGLAERPEMRRQITAASC